MAARGDELNRLPADLPVPQDDGAAAHLAGRRMPPVALPSSRGGTVRLDLLTARWTVVYCFPAVGRPDLEPPGGIAAWNAIPGARGCTPQACAYRDHHQELRDLGAEVYGVSTQPTEDLREAAARLALPFEMLSDAGLELARALRLPTFEAAGRVLLRRLTLILAGGRIEHVRYPVFPPDADAASVAAWLRQSTAGETKLALP
ncbi:MAG TPA: peroxiredoxin [Thermoanaerobaculia bacterium]|nr:peroxiredoxin [Thermoanaerobaculia bacterium]